MTNLNIYSQKGCIGCKSCEGGAGQMGRTFAYLSLALITGGIWLFVPLFHKKCQYCGHNTWANMHYGPDQRSGMAH